MGFKDQPKSNFSSFRSKFYVGAALVLFSGSAAFAQGADSTNAATGANSDAQSDDRIQEIVVTAQFSNQSSRDVPIAITAVSGETLEARGQTNLVQIGQAAPGLSIRPAGQYGNAAAVTIRGVGNFNPLYGFEPGVGIYIDDVYYPTLYGAQLDLLDLDRIEILRGPQGTLAGKNSIGGAIKLYSQKPDGGGDGYIEATVGERSQHGFRGAGDFTLVPDHLFVRVAGVYKKVGGYVDRIDFKCRHPSANVPSISPQYASDPKGCKIGTEGGTDFAGVRGSLRYVADDRFEANLQFDVYKDDSEATPDRLIAVKQDHVNAPLFNQFLDSGKYESYSTFQTQTGRGYPGRNRLKGYGLSGKLEYNLSDAVNLTSITAYRSYAAGYQVDLDGTSFGLTTEDLDLHFHYFSQELRVGGSFLDDAVSYTLGGLYYKSTGVQAGYLQIAGVAVAPPTIPTAFVLNALQGDIAKSESKAVFFNAIIHPVPDLDISAGVRYTDDEKNYFYHRRDAVTLLPVSPPDGLSGQFKDGRFDYRIALGYHWTPDILTYASFATGFKGGGVNPSIYRAEQIVPFGPESLTAWEGGVKASLFDRHVTVDLSGFYNKYKDIQLIINTGTGIFAPPASIPVNAGAAKVKGVEFETNVSFGEFKADASFSLLDFDYTEITPGTGIAAGMITPYTSKTKWSVGAQYGLRFGANENLVLTPRVDVSYQSGIYSQAANGPLNFAPGYTIMNAHLKFANEDQNWEFDLGVSNLLNKYYYNSVYSNLYALQGTVQGVVGAPRQISGTLRYHF